MNKFRAYFLLFLVFTLILGACGNAGPVQPETTEPTLGEFVDYAASLTLDLSSESAKEEVTVKTYVDGDTAHFYVSDAVHESGILKGRFLGINTPESTGKIEEYGKKAAAFTKEKLSNAESIIIESESASWEADSTGDRYLSWVWYKTAEDQDYRNLNLELLQNGLSLASNSADNQYGETCMAAIQQAKGQKLDIHSNQKDPDFYYGDAIELTIKVLRTMLQKHYAKKG